MVKKYKLKKYIIVKAITESDWDGVRFALIEVTKGLIKQVKRIDRLLNKNRLLINAVSVFADNADFFIDEGELPETFDLEVNDETCFVIELSDEDFYKLSRPEQDLKGGEMKFSIYGNIHFKTYGKHTGEEFWCDIRIDFIKNLVV